MAADAENELLRAVIERYLASGDFNGLFVDAGNDARLAGEALIRAGAIEVIATEDFPNPHIRPWASRRSVDDQIASLRAAVDGRAYGVCLYPTAAALAENPALQALADQPYKQRLAAGGGQLDIAYFRMDVLESYRNDPRFKFEFSDFGARAAVTDSVYEDQSEIAADKVSMRLGFAYQLPLENGRPIERLVCAFLWDLAKLSPAHQRRWETYEVAENGAEPHPIWFAEAMGHWIDRIGPFDALFAELSALNELYELAFGVPLLRRTNRPSDFGWLLRPSQLEFDNFVQTLDKLLSENMRHDALDAAGVPRADAQGQILGTLKRLELVLERAAVPEDQRRKALGALREIRAARSKPAHAIRKNITSDDFVRRQAVLLQEVAASIHALRVFWQTHPNAASWEPPAELATATRLWL